MSQTPDNRRLIRSWLALWLLPGLLAAVGVCWALAARGDQWWAQALRHRMFVTRGLTIMGCLLGLQVLGVALWRHGRRIAPLRRDEGGSAMVEMVLVFPIMLALALITAQSALLMTGNLFVHHAAFCAARSAIVVIPEDTLDEPSNELAPPEQSEKLRRIRMAAVLGVLPAAGALAEIEGGPDDQAAGQVLRDGIDRFYQQYGMPTPGWNRTILARKLDYASRFTEVAVAPPGGGLAYGPREDIKVTVRHKLYLAVPFVGRFLGDELDGANGEYATEVSVTYVLTNQGYQDIIQVEKIPGTDNPLIPR